jgi:hypothetical protein
MRVFDLPQQDQPTAVRKALRRAELVRYWWEYRGRLHELLAIVDPSGASRLTKAERDTVRGYWRRFDIGYLNDEWNHLFKALTGKVDPRWVPEETFRTRLEPFLCRRDVAAAYHDKNQIDRTFADLPRPRTILRNIYGLYFDEQYRPIPREAVLAHAAQHSGWYFLKPAISGTGSGNNVARVECLPNGLKVGNAVLDLDEIERAYVQDFLLQEAVPQHPWFAKFHPQSLNTVRTITLRIGERCTPIAATLRMGNGRPIDNGHAGGLLCGVDLANGAVTPFACDVLFRKYYYHPRSGEPFADQVVPALDAILSVAREVHQRLAYFDVISCDIAMRADGSPCLVEVNTFGQGIEPHQFLHGGPIFGDHTEHVLSVVASRARAGWNQ